MYRIYLNDAQRCLKRMIDNVGKQYRKNINYWNSTILKYRFSFSKQLCISLIEFDSYFRLSVGPSPSSLFPQCSTYIIVGSGWRTIWDGEYHFHRINNNNNNDSYQILRTYIIIRVYHRTDDGRRELIGFWFGRNRCYWNRRTKQPGPSRYTHYYYRPELERNE